MASSIVRSESRGAQRRRYRLMECTRSGVHRADRLPTVTLSLSRVPAIRCSDVVSHTAEKNRRLQPRYWHCDFRVPSGSPIAAGACSGLGAAGQTDATVLRRIAMR